MGLNPMQIIKLKERLNSFRTRHPGFTRFIGVLRRDGVPEGSVLDVKITYPDGRTGTTNFRVSDEDIEFIRTIAELGS